MKRLLALILIAIALLPQVAFAKPAVPSWRDHHPWSTEVAEVTIDSVTIQAEIADTSQLQTRGLGYRDGLDEGTGMLFDFGAPSSRTFWMKGMRFCLDIIWIEDGQIVGAAENACPEPNVSDENLTRYPSGQPITYVLEVTAGTMAANGWSAGSQVEIRFPDDPQTP